MSIAPALDRHSGEAATRPPRREERCPRSWYHAQLPPLPPEAAERIRAGVKAGKRDDFGVRPINVFVGAKDGYCLTEAPDAAAVVASHKAQGLACGSRT